MSLRAATKDDVEALAAIHVLAMPMDPNFPYLFPNISEYEDEYLAFAKDSITSAMNALKGRTSTLLIEVPDDSAASGKRIVAFAVWETSNSSTTSDRDLTGQTPSASDEKDEDKASARIWLFLPKARWDAYTPASTKARLEILEERYGSRQLFLGEMVVHPEFQRRGFGKMLMRWGIEKARRENLAVTTFASAAGRGLYESFGLREVGVFRTQVEGEDEYIDNPILAMDAPE